MEQYKIGDEVIRVLYLSKNEYNKTYLYNIGKIEYILDNKKTLKVTFDNSVTLILTKYEIVPLDLI